MKPKKTTSRQALRIGIWGVVAAVLFFVGLNFLKGVRLFDESEKYYIFFEDASGLDRSSKVYLNGVDIGNVREVDFDYTSLAGALLELHLDKELRLPKGTRGYVDANPLASARIRLLLPEEPQPGAYLQPGDTIRSHKPIGLVAQIQNDIVPQISKLSLSMDSLVRDLSLIARNPNIPEAFERINRSALSIQSSSTQLNSLLHNQVPSILNSVDSSAVAVAELTEKVNRADIEQALTDFTNVIANLQKISLQLNRTDNTMGLLLNDSLLYLKLQDATISADSLLRDIKANPKRYVRFSLF